MKLEWYIFRNCLSTLVPRDSNMNRFVRQLSHSSFDCRQLFHLAISCHSLFHAIIFWKMLAKRFNSSLEAEILFANTFILFYYFSFFYFLKPRLKEQKAEKEKLAWNFLSLFSPLDHNKSETNSFFFNLWSQSEQIWEKNEPVDSYFRFALVFK